MYSFVSFTEVHFFVFLCLIISAYGWGMVEGGLMHVRDSEKKSLVLKNVGSRYM